MKKIKIIAYLFSLSFSSFSQTSHFNTNETEVAVVNSNYELAKSSKKELVSQKSISEIKNIDKDDFLEEDKIAKNGFFIDGMLGVNLLREYENVQSIFTPVHNNLSLNLIQFGMKVGNKWYFRNDKKYKPGLQMTWLKAGLLAGESFGFFIAPLNVGFVNLFVIGNIGIEANLNFGIIYMAADWFHPPPGLLINPEIKFRYKSLVTGIDIGYMRKDYSDNASDWTIMETANYEARSFSFGVTIGVKF